MSFEMSKIAIYIWFLSIYMITQNTSFEVYCFTIREGTFYSFRNKFCITRHTREKIF